MQRLLFLGGAVFDGRERHAPGLGVLVEGGRIAEVAPAATFEGFAGERVDTTGMTLLPGLIDAHVHLAFDASDAPDGGLDEEGGPALEAAVAERAMAALRGGFVALRDCGGPGTAEFVVRDAIRDGRQAGPVVQACGRMIRKALNGFGDLVAFEAPSDDRVPGAVRDVAATGADFINIMTTIDGTRCALANRPAYDAAAIADGVKAAHAVGLKTISNAQCADDVRATAAAGVVSIEQGSRMDDEGLAAMLENGVALVPILLARHNMDQARIARGGAAADIEAAAELAECTREAARKFAAAGGRMALGTDCGAPGSCHGSNVEELALLVEAAGLAPLDVLRAATRTGADLMGLADMGRIAPGARASLLLVAGDPLADIAAVASLKNHRGVWHDGARIPAA